VFSILDIDLGYPRGWPRPDVVTVCTSPEFVEAGLLETLRKIAEGEFYNAL
jgi:hypothetical protein